MEIKTEIINGKRYVCVDDLENLFSNKKTILAGFDKLKFADILSTIYMTYNNQYEFAKLSTINRTYLSKFMNLKIDNPPKPMILRKIAKASKGITTYKELMQICGYLDGIEE